MNYKDSQIGKYLEHFPAYFDDEHVKGVHVFHSLMQQAKSGATPPANMFKHEEGLEVVVAVPGKKESDFQLFIQGPHVTLVCEPTKSGKEDPEAVLREYTYDSFSRVFRLPFTVTADQLEMNYSNGEFRIWVSFPTP